MPARDEVPTGKAGLRGSHRINIPSVNAVSEADVTEMVPLSPLLEGKGA